MVKKTTEKKAAKPAAKAQTAKADKEKTATEDAPKQTGNPMFYEQIAILNATEHGDLKVKELDNFKFAAGANSIVLTVSEFSIAALDYPIVFGKSGDSYTPFAVTGYKQGENVFVDDKGNWRDKAYVPAYVRRYPFFLAESNDRTTLSLGVDLAYEGISKKDGKAIYDKGEPGEVAKNALNFCARFRGELEKTNNLMKQLADMDLLVERSATVQLRDNDPARIVGFSIVDEKKLNELDDAKFLELRKSGLLTLIYCHLWSMRIWDNLLA